MMREREKRRVRREERKKANTKRVGC